MLRISCIAAFFILSCLLRIPLSAQNLISNGGFETFSLCPSGYNQGNNLVDWQGGNLATPDYFNCSFYGTSVQGSPAQGSGVIGVWGGASHFSCPTSGYAENVVGTLTAPLTNGLTYTISFKLQVDGNGVSSGAPNDCMQFGFYFFNAGNAPDLSSLCCESVTPQVAVKGGQVLKGIYTAFNLTFTATDAWDKVLVGTFCTPETSTGACANYSINRMYFNADEIDLQESAVLPVLAKNPLEKDTTTSAPNPVFIYPNPVEDQAKLMITLPETHCIVWRSVDISGQVMQEEIHALDAGKHALPLDVNGWAPGIYFLELWTENGDLLALEKLVKR